MSAACCAAPHNAWHSGWQMLPAFHSTQVVTFRAGPGMMRTPDTALP